ncbi:MAG: Lrp/AsnC ligand binding domain-containing protein [Candidatus Bathyarchaeia archaeon]
MPAAYVLINTEIGFEEEVSRELKKTPNITEVYVVYGIYDVVAKVEAETMEKLKEIVTQKIRQLKEIRSTLTMIVVAGK